MIIKRIEIGMNAIRSILTKGTIATKQKGKNANLSNQTSMSQITIKYIL